MCPFSLEDKVPRFYGATTIGERGQVVIPAEARKDYDLTPSTKVMVFGGSGNHALFIIKAESVSEMLAQASQLISGFAELLEPHVDNKPE